MTSATNYVQSLGVLRVNRGREVTKTRGLLPKAKGEVRMQKGQRKAQSVIQTRKSNHPQELQKEPGISTTSSRDADVSPSPSLALAKATTIASDIDVQLLQVLRESPAFQNQGMGKKYYRMKESNRSQFTGDKMNHHVWKQRFRATVYSQRRLISDKEKALATAIDKRRANSTEQIGKR
jgi:hypothetical protein